MPDMILSKKVGALAARRARAALATIMQRALDKSRDPSWKTAPMHQLRRHAKTVEEDLAGIVEGMDGVGQQLGDFSAAALAAAAILRGDKRWSEDRHPLVRNAVEIADLRERLGRLPNDEERGLADELNLAADEATAACRAHQRASERVRANVELVARGVRAVVFARLDAFQRGFTGSKATLFGTVTFRKYLREVRPQLKEKGLLA